MKNNITENVQNIPITEIKPFRKHPFMVTDNEDIDTIKAENVCSTVGKEDKNAVEKSSA